MSFKIPARFRLSGVHAGIKQASDTEDISLVVSDVAAVGVGVFTQNQFRAAPVVLDERRTPSETIRAIICNSGNANACTGDQGFEDAVRMAELVGANLRVDAKDVLVLSTGIIGQRLPMEKIESGIRLAASKLGTDEASAVASARGIMTTDTRQKISRKTLTLQDADVTIFGFAKGAAMIGPNMATMLGIVLTDAALRPADAQRILHASVDVSFNCISVEGHTSTNDSVLLLANGAAVPKPLGGADLERFGSALKQVCVDLAKQIPGDGEGATHRIEIQITGAESGCDARQIARTVANSPLVKTAITGADPNWGRIISAVGYAGVTIDPKQVRLTMNGTLLFENATPVDFDAEEVSKSIRDNRETLVEIEVGQGSGGCEFWTCDMTAEYIRLNADYHT